MNSHYVPRLVLRKFKDKLSLYNVKTGEFREEIKIENAYAEQNFYNDETEKNLATMLEGPFGNLLANKLLKCQGTVELSHKELNLIKKFLLLSVLRSYGADKFMLLEKNFYINQQKNSIEYWREQGLSEDEIQERIEVLKPPFEEKQIEGETLTQYWLRTLNVVLETDGTSEEILKHENKTYPAYRWAKVIESGYLAFWDSNSSRDEFVITDVGMTSENEIGWNGITVHNQKKTDFYIIADTMNEVIKEEEGKEESKNPMEIPEDTLDLFVAFTKYHQNISKHKIDTTIVVEMITEEKVITE